MRLEIEMFDCIGGMRPLDGGSPFDSASVVVRERQPPGHIVRITRYEDEGHAAGEVLTPEEWQGLCAAGHAHAFAGPVPLRAGARMWILSRSFEWRTAALTELRAAGVLLDLRHDAPSDTDVALVRENDANALRDGWATQAYEQAKELAHLGRWPRVLSLAEQAWVLGRGPVAKHWALLALCYDRVGRKKRADGMVKVARRSHGAEMAGDVEEWRKALEAELGAPASPRVVKARSWREETRHQAQSHHHDSLQQLGLKDAA